MKTLKDKVAAITGAGSGIGRATAILMASKGCHLALSDVNETGLADTAAKCLQHGVKVTTRKVDVASREQMYAWADEVVADHGLVNIIFNNAGVALGATVEDMQYSDFEWLMGVNFWGVVYGTKAFLPHIKTAGEGAVVNVSSVFGLIAVPTQSAYNAAKFAVKGFTEALREEMEIEGSNIGVTCVHPGGIKTNIARNARVTETPGMVDVKSTRDFEKAFTTTAEDAALAVVDAIMKNKRRLLIGKDAYVIDLLQRTLPTAYQTLLVAGARSRRKKLLGA
ncbi:MAG: short chain dehydrogenase/reductase family oxidoreductase [Moraxellaceae bacterium]|jgi:short-subunit dehydrogenase|nr:short chain dehydrogenase/reductase family oxidoreductase [Moraxellaceae bacterium]